MIEDETSGKQKGAAAAKNAGASRESTSESGAAKRRKRTKAPKINPEERRRLIAEAAYLRAEQRGFVGGSPEQDWLDAEAEVDRALGEEV
jgi:hypothetical protein